MRLFFFNTNNKETTMDTNLLFMLPIGLFGLIGIAFMFYLALKDN